MLKRPDLFTHGYHLSSFSLPFQIRTAVENEDWKALDDHFMQLTAPDGELFHFLKNFHDFKKIEFILSIRDAANEWEEDGIWHDDGSRVFAFSLSLTSGEIGGGCLGIKKKYQTQVALLPTPAFGEIILFLTGRYHYEHKIHRVTQGRRIIIAGWCS